MVSNKQMLQIDTKTHLITFKQFPYSNAKKTANKS